MRLYRQAELPENEQGFLCRQSRLAGVVRLIVWCGMLAIPQVVGWNSGQPWVQWIGFGVAVLVVPIMVLDLTATFRATNWLLRIDSDGVWINLRSYRDRNLAPDVPSVVRLDYGEIAHVRQHTELYTTPAKTSTEHPTEWHDKFLEFQLTHNQTDELKAALNDLRFPPQPAQSPSGPVRVRGCVSPLWFVDPSLLRISWTSGHGSAVLPRLAYVLSRLENDVRLAPPTRRERPNWPKLTPEEARELARELVHVHGETSASAALLHRISGMTCKEADVQVRQFEEERIV
jgi:hypothetical protein